MRDDTEPRFFSPGELADGRDIEGLERRLERHITDTALKLDLILAEVRAGRSETADARDEVNRLGRDLDKYRRDLAEHIETTTGLTQLAAKRIRARSK